MKPPMKQKIFFIVSSLTMGGSERVFWLLAQGFDKEKYDVSIVLLNSKNSFFSLDLENIRVIDLETIKSSRSFFKLYKLLNDEKPYAVYSTSGHINILVAFLSLFIQIPKLVARESNIPNEMLLHEGFKAKFWSHFVKLFYKRFKTIVCQSEEMKHSLHSFYKISPIKLVVIPNPVLISNATEVPSRLRLAKNIIIIARLSIVKGHERLLDIFSKLPENYILTIAGDGEIRERILDKIRSLNLDSRVIFLGQVSDITEIIPNYDAVVLSSYTEGFPNVILESLSMGVPVITFRVGGITGLIKDGFNGYILEQDDHNGFAKQIIETCNRSWDHEAIRRHVYETHSLEKIVTRYEALIA